MIKIIESMDEILDFAIELSKDNGRASYPRLFTHELVKSELEKRLKSNTSRVLTYYKNEKLCGLCAYFWYNEEFYAQTTFLLISEDYNVVADSFIQYIKEHLPNYEMFIGVPSTNIEAINYFDGKYIPVGEHSIVTDIFDLKPNDNKLNDSVVIIEKENFNEYVDFHDKFATLYEMYYNSKNLYNDMDRFLTLAYKEDGKIVGSIFGNWSTNIAEIIGCFIDEEYKNTEIRSILVKSFLDELCNKFGETKEMLYFIDKGEDEELKTALDNGFKIREEYILYKYEF